MLPVGAKTPQAYFFQFSTILIQKNQLEIALNWLSKRGKSVGRLLQCWWIHNFWSHWDPWMWCLHSVPFWGDAIDARHFMCLLYLGLSSGCPSYESWNCIKWLMAYACPKAPATVIRSPFALFKFFFAWGIFWFIRVFIKSFTWINLFYSMTVELLFSSANRFSARAFVLGSKSWWQLHLQVRTFEDRANRIVLTNHRLFKGVGIKWLPKGSEGRWQPPWPCPRSRR